MGSLVARGSIDARLMGELRVSKREGFCFLYKVYDIESKDAD